jgi:O-Antigen ligase
MTRRDASLAVARASVTRAIKRGCDSVIRPGMTMTDHPGETDRRALLRAVTAPAVAISVVALLMVPRGAFTIFALLAVLAAADAVLQRRLNFAALLRPDALASTLLGLAVLAMASTLWQAAPADSLLHGATLGGTVLLAWLIVHALPLLQPDEWRPLAVGLTAGFAVGAVLLAVEALSGQALHRAVYNVLPPLRPHASGYFERDGWVTKIRFEQINRSIAAATLLAWPMLALALVAWPDLLRRRSAGFSRPQLAAVLTILSLVVAVAISGHESSKLAILTSLLVGGLAYAAQRTTLIGVRVGWLLVIGLVVPLSLGAYHARLYDSPSIQKSGRARLIIWGFSAQRVLQAPVLGIGAGAGKVLDDARTGLRQLLPGEPLEHRTNAHQHNVYLQAWYELGLVGALMLYAAGAIALARIGAARLPATLPASRAVFVAAFMAAATMAGVSYGLWQAWFLSLFGWMVVVCVVAFPTAWRAETKDEAP